MKALVRVLCILLLSGLLACAGPGKVVPPAETYQTELWGSKITLPKSIPAFDTFKIIQNVPFRVEKNIRMDVLEAQNVQNEREFLLIVVAIERHGNSGVPFMLAFQYSIVPENADPKSRIFVDKTYLETGIFSGKYVEVDKLPNLDAFIALKNVQLAEKVSL